MTIGDGFGRRKQITAEIQTWTNRLQLAGRDTRRYHTRSIGVVEEGDARDEDRGEAFKPLPGTKKNFQRNYTIEECQTNIQQLIAEDRALARRISLTNQAAKAKLVDLDGVEKEMSIPELLVLRNDIVPKLEEAARAVPRLAQNVEVVETTEHATKWRSIQPHFITRESLSSKGHKISKQRVDYYVVEEVTDYGRPEREVFDEIDQIHDFQTRLRNAINQANKTELVEL